MKYQRIDIIVLLQVILLAITPLLFSLSLGKDPLVLTRIALVLVWIIQIIILYRHLRQSENKLMQAVSILKSGEDYQTFSNSGMTRVHEDLLNEINTAISIFRDLKIDKEANLLFFREVMENVPSGIMVINHNDRIDFINSAAVELLSIGIPASLSDLEKVRPGLSFWFKEIRGGHNIIDLNLPGRSMKLSVSVKSIRIRNEKQKRILALKDIKKEVDLKEIETWHNMLRILSHEVVNSVSPITLSATGMQRNLSELRKGIDLDKDSERIFTDIDAGLSAISLRGTSLNDFVESVRKLTRIPEPVAEKVNLKQLVKESLDILRLNIKEQGISLIEDIEDISLRCDKGLISQVMINLVKNSMEAFTDRKVKVIRISGVLHKDIISLCVEDNGSGVPDDIQGQVFSPFFSTRSRGSGLGLSFSRQVMKMHNGDINMWSKPGSTLITLTFPVESSV